MIDICAVSNLGLLQRVLLWTIFKVFPGAHMKCLYQTSLVVEWIRIYLPMQGTWVRSLVLKDSTCCRATKPLSHNFWAHVLQLPNLACPEPVLHSKRSSLKEKLMHDKDKELPLTTTRGSPDSKEGPAQPRRFLKSVFI